MSDANLQGQNLEFNIGFLTKNKTDRSEADPEYTRIDTGGLTYLEIEDNLVDMGLTGVITVKNPFQILDRLRTLRTTEDTLYLDINIEDKNSQLKSIVDKKVSFMSLLENSASITKDIIDDKIVFKFEEAQTSMLKKTSMRKVYDRVKIQREDKLGTLLAAIINAWTNEVTSGSAPSLIDADNFRSSEGGVGDITSFWDDIGDSVYSVLSRLAESVHISGELASLLKIQSVEGVTNKQEIERKFTFKEIFTDQHREFLKTIGTTGASNSSDVYLEEFVISPEEDNTAGVNSSGIFNTVEKYDLIKADVSVARDKFWGDHQLNKSGVDITNTNIELLPLPEIVNSFERNDFGGIPEFNSTIPVLSKIERKIIRADRKVNTSAGADILRDHAYNRIKKSFLFLSDVIVFNVKGQIFRKPGSFITINGGDVIGAGSPKNIWLVISVKHLFKELNYENEVIAVRLFGNSDKYSELVGEEVVSDVGGVGGYGPGGEQSGSNVPILDSKGGVAVDSKGNVNQTALKNYLNDRIAGSKLENYVPADGGRYGIKTGSVDEWSSYFMRMARYESSFKTSTTNTNDPGGSFGIFQVSPLDGSRYGANPSGGNWSQSQLNDPFINAHTAVQIHERNVTRDGRITNSKGQGAGGYFASTTMRKIADDS